MKGLKDFLQKAQPYTLTFEHRPEYLYAFVGDGTDSLEVSKEFWLRVLTECENRSYSKALIEEDLDGKIPLADLYELAVWLTQLKFENLLVGFVDRRIDHLDQNKFGELIANNRGFRVTVLESVAEAEKYILSH